MPRLMLAKVAEALALRKAWPDDFSNVYAAEEIDRVRAADLTAWESANLADEEKRLAKIGGKDPILIQFDATGPIEPVPTGKVADRIAEFIKSNNDAPSTIGLFKHRNQHALREFWAKSPSDAFEVKKMLEAALAEVGGA